MTSPIGILTLTSNPQRRYEISEVNRLSLTIRGSIWSISYAKWLAFQGLAPTKLSLGIPSKRFPEVVRTEYAHSTHAVEEANGSTHPEDYVEVDECEYLSFCIWDRQN